MAAIENRSVIRMYVFAENTTRKGTVPSPGDLDRLTRPDGSVSDDVFLWGEGTPDELAAQAVADLRRHDDPATGSSFARRCARAVLADLGVHLPAAAMVEDWRELIAKAKPAQLAKLLGVALDPSQREQPQAIVRRIVGRRHRIARAEAVLILQAIEAAGWPLDGNSCVFDDDGIGWARRWAEMVRGITCVSMSAGGLREGFIRFDQPGTMHPLQRADVMLAPDGLQAGSIDYLRGKAERLLIVVDDPAPRKGTVRDVHGQDWRADTIGHDPEPLA